MKLTPYRAVLSVRPWPLPGCACATCEKVRRYHSSRWTRGARSVTASSAEAPVSAPLENAEEQPLRPVDLA